MFLHNLKQLKRHSIYNCESCWISILKRIISHEKTTGNRWHDYHYDKRVCMILFIRILIKLWKTFSFVLLSLLLSLLFHEFHDQQNTLFKTTFDLNYRKKPRRQYTSFKKKQLYQDRQKYHTWAKKRRQKINNKTNTYNKCWRCSNHKKRKTSFRNRNTIWNVKFLEN